MNNYSYYVPLFLLVGLAFLIFFFVLFIRRSYYLSNKIKFSFMNRFPFETIYQKGNSLRNIYIGILIALCCLLFAINAIYISTFKEISVLGYAIFIGLLFILNVVCALAMFFVTPKNYRLFKIYAVLSIILAILSNATLGIISVTNIYSHFSHKIVGGFAFFLSFCNIVIAFNPKLKNWEKLAEDTNSDGTIIYVRPKISPLAFSLWINYLTIILGETLILINMILSSVLEG